MNDSEKEFLINELVDDLWNNPEDQWHIVNGLKEGYPDLAVEIGLEVIKRLEDRQLFCSPKLQQSLEEFRRGECRAVVDSHDSGC